MRVNKISISIILLLIMAACSNTKNMADKTTVKNVELEKYLGTWYEIARFPHSFEDGLVGVTATYSLREDGKIKVVNAGFKNTLNGEKSEAVGKAKIPDPLQPGKLKVSFFWIFYADYFILELDENYQWAVIGSSSDNYLWILSRTSQINDDLYNQILDLVKKRGYKLDKLLKVEQNK